MFILIYFYRTNAEIGPLNDPAFSLPESLHRLNSGT